MWPWDLAQVGNKTGATRLGFALLLKFFQREGRFPFFKNEIPNVVMRVGCHPSWSGARSVSSV